MMLLLHQIAKTSLCCESNIICHSVRLLLVDFSKAFDRVSHNILFQKLLDRNVAQRLLRWLFSYLSRRQQRTRARRITSNWQYLNGSMFKGSLLGPLAFLVQIDDLAPGCLTHKYVDDTTVTEILTSATSPSQMQSFLCTLINWLSLIHIWRCRRRG